MPDRRVERAPSETALFAALRRTIANKQFGNEAFGPDHLAEVFLPTHFRFFLKFKKIRENTKKRLDGFLPGLTETMIARTAYFDALFKAALGDGIPQIVLLGAGYDSRALRFAAENQRTRIFELDSAPTQERKKQCLRRHRIDLPHQVVLVPVDFNQDSLETVLERAGYQNTARTLFIWEGVSYYLEPEAVGQTLAFVSHHSHPGSVIAFDYILSPHQEGTRDGYGVKEFTQTMREQHGDEALLFSLEQDEIGPYLARHGLKVVEHLDNEAVERAFLTDGSGARIGKMTAHFRFAQAAVQ